MNVSYAEICRVGNLEADFQQVPHVQFFYEIFTILLWNSNDSNSGEKSKKYFLRQKLKKKKSLYYRNGIGQTNFWPYIYLTLG